MITVTIQAPKSILVSLMAFAYSQLMQKRGEASSSKEEARRIHRIAAEQWKLVHDDIERQLKEAR